MAKSPTLLVFRVYNQLSGAPYADCFKPEEEWIFLTTVAGSPRVIVRHSIFINFHKKSMMQGLITGKAFGTQQTNFINWVKWVRERLPRYWDYKGEIGRIEA